MKYKHTNIIAEDWKKLVTFYEQVFDCQLVPPLRNQSGEWLSKGVGLPNASLQGAHLLLPGYGKDGPTLEIYQYGQLDVRDPANPNHTGYTHLAFEVDNVTEVLESVLQHGGSANGEITTRAVDGVGTITFIYARDPEGNLIELQHWD